MSDDPERAAELHDDTCQENAQGCICTPPFPKAPYETPEAKLIDLGNLIDEANGILIETGSGLEKMGQEAEMLADSVEDLQARYHSVAEKVERAEAIMAKVQLIQEAKDA